MEDIKDKLNFECFNINYNFYEIMRKAIILNNKSYKKLQSNLIELSNKLFQSSLKNVQKSINKV